MRSAVAWIALPLLAAAFWLGIDAVRWSPRTVPLTPLVEDDAGVLGFYAPRLTAELRSWHDELGIDFRVVAVRGEGERAADRARELFHAREVGRGAPTGGILLYVDADAGAARVEVSYSLESVLTDGRLGSLLRHQLVPYVSYHYAGMAVSDVVHLLKDFVILEAASGSLELAAEFRAHPAVRSKVEFLSGGAGAEVRLASLPADGDLKRRIENPRRRRYAPHRDPAKSVDAFARALSELAGDPSLDLFTPGSRELRRRSPLAPFEQWERAARLAASRPLEILVQGNRAVATSSKRAHGFIPVLLHRIDSTWRVDLVETWKNLFYGADGNYVQVNSNHPYAFGLEGFGAAPGLDVAAMDLGGLELEAVLAASARRTGGAAHFARGELLFRNCFAALDALHHYEEAVRLDPATPRYAEVLGDRALYLGFPELAVDAYAQLGEAGRPKRERAEILARRHAGR